MKRVNNERCAMRPLTAFAACVGSAGLLLTFGILSAGCSSIDLPTLEESRKSIISSRAGIDSAELAIKKKYSAEPQKSDLRVRIRIDFFNRIFGALADTRSDDVRITFLATRPLVREEKSVLGIKYSNTLDIDTGSLVMNLVRLRIERVRDKRIDASLRIEGRGKIRVSGRYAGIPAGASPEIDLLLDDRIALDVSATDTGTVLLKPVPKTVMLKARFTVRLLEWGIPWNQDIPLDVAELLPAFAMPVTGQAEIPFYLPAGEAGKPGGNNEIRIATFRNSSVLMDRNILELNTDLDFRKK